MIINVFMLSQCFLVRGSEILQKILKLLNHKSYSEIYRNPESQKYVLRKLSATCIFLKIILKKKEAGKN